MTNRKSKKVNLNSIVRKEKESIGASWTKKKERVTVGKEERVSFHLSATEFFLLTTVNQIII